MRLCSDAARHGNVTRFFNHSAKNNLTLQTVLTEETQQHTNSYYRMGFFALRDIPAFTELTINYGKKFFARKTNTKK